MANNDEIIRRVEAAQVREVPGRDRTLRFIASTEQVARDGDIVRVAGWETEEFLKNPVFLWGHQHNEPPIGKVTRVKKALRPGGGPRLEIDVEFAGLEQLNERAETVYLMYRDRFLNSVSVGFLPKDFEEIGEEKRKKLGLGKFGRVISRAELLEVSAVPVPADTGAVLIDDDEDRAVVQAQLLSVRGMAPPEDQPRFDALAASLDVATASPPEPVDAALSSPGRSVSDLPSSSFDTLAEQITALRALVEERLPKPLTGDVTVPPAPADVPAAPEPPTPPTQSGPSTRDIYGIVEAVIDRRLTKERTHEGLA